MNNSEKYDQVRGKGMIDPLSLYIHQDSYVWKVITWVIPIEAGIIASSFSKPGLPGFLIILIGMILIISFWMYGKKAIKDRDVNLDVIDSIKPEGFRLTSNAHWFEKGSFWFKIQFGTILITNVFLGILEFLKWQGELEGLTTMFFGN